MCDGDVCGDIEWEWYVVMMWCFVCVIVFVDARGGDETRGGTFAKATVCSVWCLVCVFDVYYGFLMYYNFGVFVVCEGKVNWGVCC